VNRGYGDRSPHLGVGLVQAEDGIGGAHGDLLRSPAGREARAHGLRDLERDERATNHSLGTQKSRKQDDLDGAKPNVRWEFMAG
jgi:hypothetical protein